MLDTGAPFDPRTLRDAFGRFASGVTVITMLGEAGKPTAVTVSSFSSLSLDPALCLFSLGKSQASSRWIADAAAFNINVLSTENEPAAWQCARPAEDKLAGLDWTEGHNGLPLLTGALAQFECTPWNIYDGGDHIIVVGQILRFRHQDGAPLLFYRGKMTTTG